MQTVSPGSDDSGLHASGGYIPGVCNINTAEIAYRRKSANILLAVTLVVATAIFALQLDRWVRLFLVAPVFLTVVCYLQVKYKFCVSYGAAGKQNAIEGDKEAQDIVDAAAKKLDHDRTRKIKFQALGIAVVITAVLTLLPL